MSGRLRRFIFTCALVACLPSTCAAQSGHDIRLRILDAKSGKPLRHIWAGLIVLNERNEVKLLLEARTNSLGVAVFDLTDPLPERVGLLFDFHEFGNYSEHQFLTDYALKDGVVGKNCCAR